MNKKFKSALFALSIGAMSFTSCKKDKKSDISINAGISFDVNGTLKTASGINNVYATLSADNKNLHIEGNISIIEKVQIDISNYKGAGEYNVQNNAKVIYTNGIDSLKNVYYANTGIIKILNQSKNDVKGTFEFYSINKLGNFKEVSKGSFNAEVK